MSNCIVIRETRKRDRTQSGRWSRKTYDHRRRAWSEEQFRNGTDAGWKAFFGARETRRYTYLGYVPCRWTYEDPSGTGYVDTYKVVHFDSLGYRERFALGNATAIDLVEDAHELAVVHQVTEDGERRSCTLDLETKTVVGQMCTTYVFQGPKTGNHLEVWESWGPLEPSDTVPDVAGRKTSFSKMTRTLNMVPAPVPRGVRSAVRYASGADDVRRRRTTRAALAVAAPTESRSLQPRHEEDHRKGRGARGQRPLTSGYGAPP